MQNRREFPRKGGEDYRIKVVIISEDTGSWVGPVTSLYCAHDFSCRGVSFDTYEDIPVNAYVRIDAALGDGRVASLPAMVRWRRKLDERNQYRIGVEVLEKPSGARETWSEYVEGLDTAQV